MERPFWQEKKETVITRRVQKRGCCCLRVSSSLACVAEENMIIGYTKMCSLEEVGETLKVQERDKTKLVIQLGPLMLLMFKSNADMHYQKYAIIQCMYYSTADALLQPVVDIGVQL